MGYSGFFEIQTDYLKKSKFDSCRLRKENEPRCGYGENKIYLKNFKVMKVIVVLMIVGILETIPKTLKAKFDKLEIWVRVKSILTWVFVVSENIEKITGIFRKLLPFKTKLYLQ